MRSPCTFRHLEKMSCAYHIDSFQKLVQGVLGVFACEEQKTAVPHGLKGLNLLPVPHKQERPS